MNTLAEVRKNTEQKMHKSLDALKADLGKVRTGRAHAGLLDHISVDYYGSQMPIPKVANVSLLDARTLGVSPWEKKMLGAIEKAIRASDLGLNPSNDGKVIRVPIPPLTEERRKELSRHVHKLTEEGRNGIRGVRRDANERLKKLLKDHKISEDDEKKGLDEVQKLTDNQIKLIDDVQKKKDADLLGK